MANMLVLEIFILLCWGSASAQLLPKWAPTWNMQDSTIVMPCNSSGFLEPVEFYAQFGIVDLDWSNAKSLWVHPPMNAEELLIKQASILKAVRPAVKVFVYRNLIKGKSTH